MSHICKSRDIHFPQLPWLSCHQLCKRKVDALLKDSSADSGSLGIIFLFFFLQSRDYGKTFVCWHFTILDVPIFIFCVVTVTFLWGQVSFRNKHHLFRVRKRSSFVYIFSSFIDHKSSYKMLQQLKWTGLFVGVQQRWRSWLWPSELPHELNPPH